MVNRSIQSLIHLPRDSITDGIIRFFFEFSENIHIQPDWWEKLAENKREVLIHRMNTSANPQLPRMKNCIAEDGITFDNWSVLSTKTIGY